MQLIDPKHNLLGQKRYCLLRSAHGKANKSGDISRKLLDYLGDENEYF